MNSEVLEDLANQTARIFGQVDIKFARKMSQRLRKKFSLTVPAEILLSQAMQYQAIYQFASSILAEYLRTSPDGYAHFENVDLDKFIARLHEQFPTATETILKTIGGWVVYYEYLR